MVGDECKAVSGVEGISPRALHDQGPRVPCLHWGPGGKGAVRIQSRSNGMSWFNGNTASVFRLH